MKKSEWLSLVIIIVITAVIVTLVAYGYMVVAALIFVPVSVAGILPVIIVIEMEDKHETGN